MSSFARELVAQVEEGIRVLRIRDGLALTDAQIHERAANIVTGLLGLYDVRPLAPVEAKPAAAAWAPLRRLFHRTWSAVHPVPTGSALAGRHR